MFLKRFVGILIIVIAVIIYSEVFSSACLFKLTPGLPCPSCGITRAWLFFLQGDLNSALYYHPLFWIVIVIGVLFIYQKKVDNKIWLGIIVLILGVYFYRMAVYFPDKAPMDYMSTNLLSSILKNR